MKGIGAHTLRRRTFRLPRQRSFSKRMEDEPPGVRREVVRIPPGHTRNSIRKSARAHALA